MPVSIRPLVDATGQVTTGDHPGIADPDTLLRGITSFHVSPDGKGGQRISSIAYNGGETYDHGMSLNNATLMQSDDVNPANFMSGQGFIGSVQFTAATIRAIGLRIGYDPEAGNPYHCQAWGKMTDGRKNRLKRAATWFQQIPAVSLV